MRCCVPPSVLTVLQLANEYDETSKVMSTSSDCSQYSISIVGDAWWKKKLKVKFEKIEGYHSDNHYQLGETLDKLVSDFLTLNILSLDVVPTFEQAR